MITETESLVKHYLKENSRLPNIFKNYRNEFGNNIRHPQQLGVVLSDNIIFRRITHSVKNTFDKWLADSELGQAFNKHPYFLRVLNYIDYRSTDYMREGFILRNEHLVNGSAKIRPFDGERKRFMKYLYVLEKLGVIIIDKRMYCNFVWVNYDVVGQYPLQDKSRFPMTDDDIKEWKLENRIYSLSKVDQRAKLELLWEYQMGSKAHYDMFTDKLFSEYMSSPAPSKTFESGYTDINTYDKRLRDDAFDSRRVRIMGGGETRPIEKGLPIHEFKFGGEVMKTGKKHKTPEEKFGGIQFESDVIQFDTIPTKEKVIVENKFEEYVEEKEDLPVEKTKPSDIDWDTVDLAAIDFDKVPQYSKQGFERHLANHLDDLFTEGLNASGYAKEKDIKFTKSFSSKAPPSHQSAQVVNYHKAKGMIISNLYIDMVERGYSNDRMRKFVTWSGKSFFNNFKHDSLKWYTRDIEPTILTIANKPNPLYPTSGVKNAFHKIYMGLVNKKVDKQNTRSVNSTPKNNQTETIMKMQQEIKRLNSMVGKITEEQVDEIKKKTAIDKDIKIHNLKERNAKFMKAMEEAGIDPLEVLLS